MQSRKAFLIMALILYKNEAAPSRLKATIQRTGKLGFTEATATHLQFKENSIVQFAEDDQNKGALYLINAPDSQDETVFKVCKAGRYFYVNTKALFDKLGLDYEANTIIFDLKRATEYTDMEVYKMKKRILPRKNK